MKFFILRSNSAVRTIRKAKSKILFSFVIRYFLFDILQFEAAVTSSSLPLPNEFEKLFLGEQLDSQFAGLG